MTMLFHMSLVFKDISFDTNFLINFIHVAQRSKHPDLLCADFMDPTPVAERDFFSLSQALVKLKQCTSEMDISPGISTNTQLTTFVISIKYLSNFSCKL